jgi:hypothetical protein
MVGRLMNLMDLEGSFPGLIMVLSRHLSGKTEKICKQPQAEYPVSQQRFKLGELQLEV